MPAASHDARPGPDKTYSGMVYAFRVQATLLVQLLGHMRPRQRAEPIQQPVERNVSISLFLHGLRDAFQLLQI